ncbi:hypothetical protein GF386_05665 [Candidatus Pacearchaeota archaeon]|nr:hypothetical protein [Candidatus Pacearchaeota archaeon]
MRNEKAEIGIYPKRRHRSRRGLFKNGIYVGVDCFGNEYSCLFLEARKLQEVLEEVNSRILKGYFENNPDSLFFMI